MKRDGSKYKCQGITDLLRVGHVVDRSFPSRRYIREYSKGLEVNELTFLTIFQ